MYPKQVLLSTFLCEFLIQILVMSMLEFVLAQNKNKRFLINIVITCKLKVWCSSTSITLDMEPILKYFKIYLNNLQLFNSHLFLKIIFKIIYEISIKKRWYDALLFKI